MKRKFRKEYKSPRIEVTVIGHEYSIAAGSNEKMEVNFSDTMEISTEFMAESYEQDIEW